MFCVASIINVSRHSFISDTLVHTRNGQTTIKDIKVGDSVLSYAEWNGQESHQSVTNIIISENIEMNIETELAKVELLLTGEKSTTEEILSLKRRLPKELIPDWLCRLLTSFPLAGCYFEVDEDEDLSDMGVELLWLTPEGILSEVFDAYPGILVIKQGYLPIGACAIGSGDYYYLKLTDGCNDPALVRIPHESAVISPYPEDDIDLVFEHLSELFKFIFVD